MKPEDLAFVKIEGCGNNFVVIAELRQLQRSNWAALSRQLLDRNFGIGGDGVMLIRPSKTQDFEVLMFNPDGSLGGMCGNGVRCVVRYLVLNQLISPDERSLSLDFAGRVLHCTYTQEGRQVKVDMGPPIFEPSRVPVRAEEELILAPIEVLGQKFEFTALSMGNPHCVIFVPRLEAIDLAALGPALEHHPLFPERANVEFVEQLAPDRVRMKVWERGAGATLACGSGACAVVVAGARNGLCAAESTVVELPGGQVQVAIEGSSGHVFLSGPAQEVFFGTIPLDLLPSE